MILFGYIFANIVLYLIEKLTSQFIMFHRIVSLINTFALFAVAILTAFSIEPAFAVVVPIVLAFEFPIVWGIRTELSKDDAASLVIVRSVFPIPSKVRKIMALAFLEIATFPFFYVMKTWSKRKIEND